MSYQRTTTAGMAGSASYSEFLKDIYSSLRTLTTGLAMVNTRLDTISQQLQSFDGRLTSQDQRAEFLAARIDTLIQQSETVQTRQSTNRLSILNELDTLGTQQIEPSTIINDIAARVQTNPRVPASRILFDIPEISITEDEQDTQQNQQDSLMGIYKNKTNQPTTAPSTASSTFQLDQILNQESEQQQGQILTTNFLILD
jgi:hypothetical protein